MRPRGRPWSLRRRWRFEARKALRALEREIAARVDETVTVDPCPRCGSDQLCRPECPIAPWNQEDP